MLKKADSIFTGWIVFVIALIVYTITLEPTTSFWDCSEFILSAAKLEVNHPAGAPLFMLLGRLFSLLSFGNPQRIAWAINFMSGFFSALTIFFLFHIIELLFSKVSNNRFLVIGSAALGAISFSVSDSFWFSAVEGEVYGLSMFFLVLTFWAALKWEQAYEKPGNVKWILFISLITGLGIGVHLLNLLVLPSVVMIFGFKKYGYSLKNLFLFFGLGCVLLLSVLYILTPTAMKFLAWSDLFFVNTLNLPKHSGALSGIFALFSLLTFLFFYFKKKNYEIAVFAVLSILVFYAGFSIYSVNIIRSSANPPVNFGRPDNIYSMINYLNREQYPKRPLIYGENYNSPIIDVEERYSKDFLNGKYRDVQLASNYKYAKNTSSLFPRIYSKEERHIEAYQNWIDITGKKVSVTQPNGTKEVIAIPGFTDHLKYFIRYQFGYMYGRYFMWNFVGRQNDRQGRGGLLDGNWLSGINFIDNWKLGDQKKIPDWMRKNKARNTYFFIPFLLGIIGMIFNYKTHKQSFYIILALFIMGGLGLTVYINEIPITPRERDYVFVGSFMAFCIWIGMSFLAIISKMKKLKGRNKLVVPVFIVLFLACPGLMAFQNFDDHNRSGRYVARDLAANILNSCPPNAILFTSGDNDTYPVLYCQEVEGIRTDVRVVIMPFLAANWFVDGLRNPKYNDPGLNMTIPQNKYDFGKLDFIPVVDKIQRQTTWKEALAFLKSDDKNAKVQLNSGENVNYLPLTNLKFEVQSEQRKGDIEVSLKNKNYLYKHELVLWDILSSNATERPVCFVSKMEAQKYGLIDNLQCEGFVYRVIPEKHKAENIFSLGHCNPDQMYTLLTEKFEWGNLSEPSVYADWNTIVNSNTFQVRNVFNEVASQLLQIQKKEKAIKLLRLSEKQFPLSKIPYDIYTFKHVELVMLTGDNENALRLHGELEKCVTETLDFYTSLSSIKKASINEAIQRELYYLSQLVAIASKMGKDKKKLELERKLETFIAKM